MVDMEEVKRFRPDAGPEDRGQNKHRTHDAKQSGIRYYSGVRNPERVPLDGGDWGL